MYQYKIDYRDKIFKYNYTIPKYYKFYGWTGGYENEKQYWYADSSVFYITQGKGLPTINYKNVRSLPEAYSKLLLADTLTLRGIDNKNLHWMHIKKNDISYGYSKVPTKNLETFNRIVLSIKSRK